ncbi:hypothetical protein K3495_g13807 [Podosphaera aphanis]|nr:hypothetical protein K3495_g13807 [Podosphaera aphanis]
MVDVQALRQSYERREISEIRWVNGHDNLADAMTKQNPNKALEKFISLNKITVRLEGWVDRADPTAETAHSALRGENALEGLGEN